MIDCAVALASLSVLLASSASSADVDAREAECNRLHQELRVENGDDVKGLRDSWLAARPKCAGTGYYEYLLAADERRAGNEPAAISILEDLIRRQLPYHERAFVTLNSIRADEAARSTPPDRARLRSIRNELIAFSSDHPGLAYAHQQISQQSLTLEEFGTAAEHARKAIELDAASGAARGYLVFALHELNQCAQAIPEIKKAVDADRSLVANANFMLSAVDCYAETGDTITAESALHGLLKNRPTLKDDPRVLQLQDYLSSKTAAGK